MSLFKNSRIRRHVPFSLHSPGFAPNIMRLRQFKRCRFRVDGLLHSVQYRLPDPRGREAPPPRYAEAVNRRSRAEGSLPMKYDVVVETVQVELVAAVRATAPIGDIARAWKPALDQMWAFLNKEWRVGAWTQPVPLSPPGTAGRGDEHRLRCPGGAPVRTRG